MQELANDCGDSCFFRTPKIKSKGPKDSPFVIVGESPGAMEIAKGIPFVGNSGKVIHEVLSIVGCEIEPYFTNAVMCLPRNKDPDRLKGAVGCCHQRLMDEIKAYPRKLILSLGAGALWSLTDDYELKVGKLRGKLISSPLAEIGILPTYHPAFLLRGSGNYPQWKEDIRYAVDLAQRGNDARKVFGGASWDIAGDPEAVQRIVQDLKALEPGSPVAGDIETGGLSPYRLSEGSPREDGLAEILCLGLQYDRNHVWIIPGNLIVPELFENDTHWVWHNGKFDVQWLRRDGAHRAMVHHDNMLLSYTLNERRGIHDLDQVASDWLGAPNHKYVLDEFLPNKKTSYRVVPPPVLYKYLANDVAKTFLAFPKMLEKVQADKHLNKLYTKTLIPASEFLSRVESKGLPVDKDWVAANEVRLQDLATQPLKIMQNWSNEHVGIDINPNSPKQLHNMLYTVLRLGPITNSTDEDTLIRLPKHPFVDALLKYRKIQKGYSTYVKPLNHLVSPDGCVHPTYLLHGTATGRLASRDPNVQNIPRDPWLRGQFVASRGYVLVEPDLSQAELRSLADLSGDPGLCAIFNDPDGPSLHDAVATEFFGEGFDEEQKMIAKNVNFGIVYGITAYGLYDQLDTNGISTTIKECQGYIDAWYRRFPVAAEFIKRCGDAVTMNQTITTVFGRKKRHGVVSREKLRDLQNEAKNFPHQSIASDIMLTTATRVRSQLNEWDCWPINLVHDSLLFLCPLDAEIISKATDYVVNELQATPRRVGLVKVPFKAEAKIGLRWGSMKAAKQINKRVDEGKEQYRINTHGFQVGWAPGDPLPDFLAA